MKTKLIVAVCFLSLMFFLTGVFAADQPEFFVQLGHSATVHCTAFSPDGKYAASGGMDNNIKLWSADTGREIRTLRGHTSYITFVTFSPDGRYIVSASHDMTIRLWEVPAGREVKRIGNVLVVQHIAFSPEGDLLFGNSLGTVTLWNSQTGVARKLEAAYGKGEISAATFIERGKYILVARKSGFTVVDPQTDKIVRTFGINTASTSEVCIAFSRDGRLALVGGHNKMTLWDIQSGNEMRTFPGKAGRVNSVAFSPDDRYILSGDAGYMLKLWEAATGKEIRSIYHYRRYVYGARYGVTSVAFSPDGKRALAGYKNGSIKLWDLSREEAVVGDVAKESAAARAGLTEGDMILAADGKKIQSWPVLADRIAENPGKDMRLSVLRDRQEITLSLTPTAVKTKNAQGQETLRGDAGLMQGGVCLHSLQGFKHKVSSASVSPDGRFLTAGYENGVVSLWDMQTGRQLRVAQPHRNDTSVAFVPQGNLYLSAGDYQVALWDTEKPKPVSVWERDDISLMARALAFSYDGRYAAAAGDKKVSLYEMQTLREIRTLPLKRGAKALAFSRDDRYLAVTASMDVQVWDAQTGGEMRSLHHGSFVYAVDFAQGGRHLVSGAQHYSGMDFIHTIKLWDVATGREIRNFSGYTKSVYDVKVSADGRTLLSGGDELILWDVRTGRMLKTFTGHHDTIESVAFLPDGKSILSAGDDGTVRLWSLETGKEVAQFVSFAGGEWIAITPEGYFNASPGGAKYLNVRVGNQVYAIDNFYEKFFNPVYVASVLQGKEVEVAADIRKGILSPPDVRITSPLPGSVFNKDALKIVVVARDTGGGIDEIRLYHNGKVIGDDKRAVKVISRGNETIREFAVSLLDGVNTFRAVGFSMDRTESNPYELTVSLTAPSKEVALHVLAVGVNRYKNPALNLNYAEPDAQGIAGFFRAQGGGLFKKVEIREIYNEQATRENILAQLNRLQQTHPQDAVLIYLAGHGESISDKWYFIPHELTYPEREASVKAGGISSDDLSFAIRNIRAQKILLLVDACKSGAVLVAFRGFEDRKALSQLSRSTGVHVVAASTKDQFAAEVKELGHGVFTYTLLSGLNGKAAAGGAVTVRKLLGYVEEQLPEVPKNINRKRSTPLWIRGGWIFRWRWADSRMLQ